MGLFEASPIQEHKIQLATDLFWAEGILESRGDPHNFINQEDFNYLLVKNARVSPWRFTGLPANQTAQLNVARPNLQLLIFMEESARSTYRSPPRTANVLLYYPLFVIRGSVPLYSEADITNFLDFWRSPLIPLTDAGLHFLAEGGVRLPTRPTLAYVNRNHIQGYMAT
ncbi:MAG: hypothetical protein ACLFU8_01115 [Anaerolineales bacterium]